MLALKEPTTGAEIINNAKRLRDIFYGAPRVAGVDVPLAMRSGRPAPKLVAPPPVVKLEPIEPTPAPLPEIYFISTASCLGAELGEPLPPLIPTKITIALVQKVVAEEFGLPVAKLLSRDRAAKVVRPRHLAMALAWYLTDFGLPSIGRKFGGRDHTTVLHAVRKFEATIERAALTMREGATVAEWVKAITAAV